jgi:hypothetical protein
MLGHASTLLVIPAKAGIQCLGNFLKTLDSSFSWNDGQKNWLFATPQTTLHARHSTGRNR